jgi:hypothetical protein
MRRAMVIAACAWAAQFSGTAAADLYRWIDPDTGSVKFSSYPPPWYGDEARQRRGPKVEVIPAGRGSQVRPDEPAKEPDAAKARAAAAPGESGRTAEGLDARRKSLVTAMSQVRKPEDFKRADAALRQQFEDYKALARELDGQDPKGTEGRREDARLLERIYDGLRAQYGSPEPAGPR